MKAIIISGGTPPSKKLLKSYLEEDDFLIAADSGMNSLYDYNIMPNLILGDFDSSKKEALNFFKDNGVETLSFNSDKDYTDTHLAYIKAKERGIKDMIMFGVTGSRLDHSLGNIGLFLNSLEDGINLKIIDENNIMYVVDKNSTIKKVKNRVLSFHALSDEVKGFTIANAKYKLNNYDMKLFEPRAICNEFLDGDVTINFKSGKVLIILSKD